MANAVVFVSQQRPALSIDDGHVFRAEIIDGAGHQEFDRSTGVVAQLASTEFENNGGFSFAFSLREERVVRQNDMHARSFDSVDRLNRALQLAFKRALIVHLLSKIAARPVWLVEDFKPEASILRKALCGKIEADFIELIGGHFERSVVGRKLIWNILRRKLRRNLLRFARIQIGIKCLVLDVVRRTNKEP